MLLLNIGCGQQYMPGAYNWDNSTQTKTDAIVDVRKDRFPADDNFFDEIFSGNLFGEVVGNDEFVHCMNECWRVLKPGGIMTVRVPNAMYSVTFLDPFEGRHFIPATFDYFDFDKIHYQRFGFVYGFKPWEVLGITENKTHILEVKMKKHDA